MNHNRASVEVLPFARERHASKFSPCAFAVQDATGIKHRHPRAERAADPFNQAAFFDEGAFGVKVHHVARPVLYRRVAEACPFLNEEFDATRVEVRDVVFWSRATFYEVELCTWFDDYQRVLKLPSPRRVQSEVRLQRYFDINARRHVDETAARPNRSMQRRKLMVFRRDERHKIFAYNVLVLNQRLFHVGVDDAQISQPLLYAVIDDLRIILRPDSRQRFLFRVGYAEPVECPLNLVGHLRPVIDLLSVRLDVSYNLVHV